MAEDQPSQRQKSVKMTVLTSEQAKQQLEERK